MDYLILYNIWILPIYTCISSIRHPLSYLMSHDFRFSSDSGAKLSQKAIRCQLCQFGCSQVAHPFWQPLNCNVNSNASTSRQCRTVIPQLLDRPRFDCVWGAPRVVFREVLRGRRGTVLNVNYNCTLINRPTARWIGLNGHLTVLSTRGPLQTPRAGTESN